MSKRQLINDFRRASEKKYFDTQFVSTPAVAPVDSTGLVVLLSDIAQGTGDVNRVGNQVCAHSMEIRYNVRKSGTTTGLRYLDVRLCFFSWQDDTVPTLGDIYQYSDVFNSPYTHDLKVKRKILWDTRIKMYLDNTDHVAYKNFNICEKYLDWRYKENGGYIINFQGNGINAVGHIYCLVYSSNTTFVDAGFINITTRINYTDA